MERKRSKPDEAPRDVASGGTKRAYPAAQAPSNYPPQGPSTLASHSASFGHTAPNTRGVPPQPSHFGTPNHQGRTPSIHAPPSGAGVVPPGYFAPAFPFMPMAPFQAMAPADNKGEGMKALECLMTLLVDEMRDMKRGLASLHQEFTELRKKHEQMEKEHASRPTSPAATPSFYPLPEPLQDKYSDLFVQLPFLSRYPLFAGAPPFVVDDTSKPSIAFKILEQRGVVPPVFIWANEPFLQMVDFTLAELVELPLLKLSMIDFKVTRQLRSLVREPGPSLVSEAAPISPLLVRRDGSMVRIVTRLQVYFGPNKLPKWAIIVVDNVEQDTRVHHPVSWFPGLPRWWQRMAVEAAQSASSSPPSSEMQGEAGGGEQLATAGSDELAMDDGFSDLIAQLMELQQDPSPSSTTPLPESHPFV